MRLHGEFEIGAGGRVVEVYMPSFMDGQPEIQNMAGFYIKFFPSRLDASLWAYREWRRGLVFDYGLGFGDGTSLAVWNVPVGCRYAFYQINGFVPERVGVATVNLRISVY